jgi:hypothetical protein
MPIKIQPNEREEDFISRCIATEIESGYSQEQSAAICYSYWRRDKMSKITNPTSKVMAKVKYDRDFRGINLKDENDPCTEGYEQYGMKDMDGRQVPNCIPIKED